MRFAVIGGDMRTAGLCRLLDKAGETVSVYALNMAGLPEEWQTQDVKTAVEGADCVVLPLPAKGDDGTVNAPFFSGKLKMEELFDAVAPGSLVCAGQTDDNMRVLASRRNIVLADYFRREELAVKNAALTAEGAVEILIGSTSRTLQKSRVLIVGWGRIGRVLAYRLRGMGADVTVSSRQLGHMAWCQVLGFGSADTRELKELVGDFDIIVNTVPAKVLGWEELSRVRKGALVMDLASKPGGLDFDAAAKLEVDTVWALSLPGKAAPDSAGEIILETIYNIVREREKGDGANE